MIVFEMLNNHHDALLIFDFHFLEIDQAFSKYL